MNKEQPNPFKICNDYLKRREIVYKINVAWKDKILESLSLMDKVICKLSNGEVVDFKFTVIEEVINLLTSLISEKLLDDKLRSFIHAYVFLAHNVNENTFKYPVVKRKIEYLQRYTEHCLTYSETQNLMKKVVEKLSKFRGDPPSFRLSKHYYDLIK